MKRYPTLPVPRCLSHNISRYQIKRWLWVSLLLSGMYSEPSHDLSLLSGAQYAPFAPHTTAFQTPPADFGFYVQQQEHLANQNTMMTPSLLLLSDGFAHRPLYMMGGSYHSPSFTTWHSRIDPYPQTYTTLQPPPIPLYQQTSFAYNPTALQQSRPVTSSSSGSPDEALMTPLLHTESQHTDNQSQYLSSMAFESPFSTSPSMLGLAHGLEGMSCLPQPVSPSFSSDYQKTSTTSHQPPPLARRNTDDLPFTDSPLSRSATYRQKPYDVTSSHTQRPSSHLNYQSGGKPTAQLSVDNNFLAKQRIACQGCRGEYYSVSSHMTLLILFQTLSPTQKRSSSKSTSPLFSTPTVTYGSSS